MLRNERGLTLLELLTVVAIIALLVALMFPVLTAARERSQRTVCVSNLRQIVASALMYRQDYGNWAPALSHHKPYLKSVQILTCPRDPTEKGAAWYVEAAASLGQVPPEYTPEIRYSYYYLMHHYYPETDNRSLVERIIETPNYGLLVCVLHNRLYSGWCDQESLEIGTALWACEPYLLRARIDGSVQSASVPLRWENNTGHRDLWRIYTGMPCTPDVCPNDDGE